MQAINSVKGAYVQELLGKGIREDHRGAWEYRNLVIKPGVLPNAEGSAQVDLGNTKVLAAIKMGVGTPMPDKPEEGNLMTMAELLPLASADYETGPPSPDSIELARVVDRGIRAANVVDLPSLFIEKDKVWSVFIDLYVLNYDGNLFDACQIAAMTALNTAKMPKYEDGKVIRDANMPKLKINNMVTSCTFAKVGDRIILDANSGEEAVMSGRLTIATDDKVLRAMQKGMRGAFSQDEIEHLIETTFEKSKELRALIVNSKSD